MSTQAEAVRDEHAVAEVPPHYQLLQMITGYWLTQSIYVAAKLGIADLVADLKATWAYSRSDSGQHLRRLRAELSMHALDTGFDDTGNGAAPSRMHRRDGTRPPR